MLQCDIIPDEADLHHHHLASTKMSYFGLAMNLGQINLSRIDHANRKNDHNCLEDVKESGEDIHLKVGHLSQPGVSHR